MAELAPQDKKGSYSRPSYGFNREIGVDPSLPDEAGRYHLYVGNPCPWCHRARLVVALKNIVPEEMGVTQLVDDPVRASRGGWVFGRDAPDPLGSDDLFQLYETLSPNYQGRCTAPLLVDLKTKKIVSNESSDIVRTLNRCTFGNTQSQSDHVDLYPPAQRALIDETNAWTYELLNNGVYRCGFGTQQAAYDAASADVRRGLDRLEERLATDEFLCGPTWTETDVRVLPTLLRFDGVYAPLFRAGGAHLRIRTDYPRLHAWMRTCWAWPGVRDTIDLADANASYYKQLFPLNPGGIVPTPVTAKDIGLED